METFDSEKALIQIYRDTPSSHVYYYGRRLPCLRIRWLTKSRLFSKSWTDSSGKDVLPPDFHNDKHGVMMEVMRIDDCINTLDGKEISNSFKRTNDYMNKYFGKGYKKRLNGSLFFVPDTRNNKEYNFEGYFNNFREVLMKHSDKVVMYRKNYPKCNNVILFVFDESNCYVQATDDADLRRERPQSITIAHNCFADSKFLEVIKSVQADYVIWFGFYKVLFHKGRRVRLPRACIYDVKHMNENGYIYDHRKMIKIIDEETSKYTK